MARGRKMPTDILAWRRKQKPGAIMKPSTFRKIERKAAASGKYRSPKRVAGAAYWKTVASRYEGRRPTKRRSR